MKKILISALVIVLAAGVGYFAYQYAKTPGGTASSSAAASSAGVSQQTASSAAAASSQSASAASSPAAASSAVSGAKQKDISSIQAAIDLDWKKYTLKASAAKVLKGKTYRTYAIWDDDYCVGPTLLVDPDDGKIYTWTTSDSAPVPAAEDKAFDKTPHTVTGTMEDGAMMSIVLKTDAGNELVVRRLGIDTTGLKSMKIGDKIKVTYTGVIKGNDTSRAFITKLENTK